jgi:hypothetical protein
VRLPAAVCSIQPSSSPQLNFPHCLFSNCTLRQPLLPNGTEIDLLQVEHLNLAVVHGVEIQDAVGQVDAP